MKNKIGFILGSSALVGTLLVSGTAFADTQAGLTVGVNGNMREGRGEMMRPAPGVFGTVSAINGTTLNVTSLPFKGMRDNDDSKTGTASAITYSVDASGAAVVKGGVTATLSQVAVGDRVMISGTVTGTSVVATHINDGVMLKGGMGGERGGTATSTRPVGSGVGMGIQGDGQPVVGGAVTAISGSTLTITNKSNQTYSVNAATATIKKAGATTTVSSIVVGDTVLVQGAVNGTAITASSVIDEGVPVTTGTPTTTPPQGGHGIFGGLGTFFKRLFGFF